MFYFFLLFLIYSGDIDLKKFIFLVKNSSYSLKIAKNNISNANIEKQKSYSSFIPKGGLSYGVSYSSLSSQDNNVEPIDLPEVIELIEQLTDGGRKVQNPLWTRKISINLPIFLGGKRYYSLLNSNLNLEQKKLDKNEIKTKR